MRTCPDCETDKDESEFYAIPSGLDTYCKRCKGARSRAYEANTDLRKIMLRSARQNARKRGVEFSLTVDDLTIPSHCPVLGLPLVRHRNTGKHGPRENSPSLDRIDNSKGYTKENSRVVSFRVNSIKKNASLEEIRAILKYMEEGHGRQSN